MPAKRMTALGALLLAALAGSALWFLSHRGQNSGALLEPSNAQIVAVGKDIYAAQCASCHGVNLEGQPDWKTPGADGLMPAPPHDESGHTWHHPDQVLFDITKLGVAKAANLANHQSAMPAYDGVLSDDEVVAVLSYIKSTWPDRIRAGHDEMNIRFAKEP